MKAKNLTVYAGLCAGVASMAAGQTTKTLTPEHAEMGRTITPKSVAKVAFQDGKFVFLSDWMDVDGGVTRGTHERVFDIFGDADSDGSPDSGDIACPSYSFAPSSRWYFGTGYCNLFFTNDMTVDAATDLGAGMTDYNMGMWWTAYGTGTTETCVIAVFTQDSAPCDPDSFDYSGWLLNYGTLTSSNGIGWYNVSIADDNTTVNWPIPTGGAGSYAVFFLSAVTTSGAWVQANCAQPMLWSDGYTAGTPNPRGTSEGPQFDDDYSPSALSHTSSECYSYYYTAYCPDGVWGAALQFFGTIGGGDPCLDNAIPNCNGDSLVNTQDFLCFLNLFASGDSAADCNGDSIVNTQDFLCFLNAWAACQ